MTETILPIVLTVALFLLVSTAFWRIAAKAGYYGVTGLLFFVPVINLLLIFFLAFRQWPVSESNEVLQEQVATLEWERASLRREVDILRQELAERDVRALLD